MGEKISFKEIDSQLEQFYSSSEDDLIDDFYNMVLSHSINYSRLSGYFR